MTNNPQQILFEKEVVPSKDFLWVFLCLFGFCCFVVRSWRWKDISHGFTEGTFMPQSS